MNLAPGLVADVLDLAVAIQNVPAPTFQEQQRAEFVHNLFRHEGLVECHLDAAGNACARLPGGDKPPLILSAHLDTVFPLEMHRPAERMGNTIHGPGIGDNSLGVAALIGVARAWRSASRQPEGDVWLIANVGEEGLGNLVGMTEVVKRFDDQVTAYVVLEGMSLGEVYNRGLGVRRFRVQVDTPGGHSWVNAGKPSAIHECAEIIHHLAAIPLTESPRTTLNVGSIHGGISINTIAPTTVMDLDLRSEDAEELAALIRLVTRLVRQASRGEVAVKMETIGLRPAGEIDKQHPLVSLAVECLSEQGIAAALDIGSTDANIPLSRHLPAVCIGITTGGGAHTSGEFIHTEPVQAGLNQVVNLVERVFKRVGSSGG